MPCWSAVAESLKIQFSSLSKEISELSPELQQYSSCCILEATKCAPFHHRVQADTFLGLDGLMSAEWDEAQTDVQPTGDHVDDRQTVLSLPAMSLDGHFAARDAQGVTEHTIRSILGDINDTLRINQRKVFHLMLVGPSNVPCRQSLPGPSDLLVSDQEDKKILQCKLPVTPSPERNRQPGISNEEENQASSRDEEPTTPSNQPPPGHARRRRRKGPPFFLRFLPKYRRIGVTTKTLQNGSPEAELVASPRQTFSPTFLGSATSR
ncbi:uncharacterized protein [Paramormyrops kingsleyae]|uniref:uncharacterized protein isoform X2 n=1 Tax=Paramormyrops kingsleyae TaxID=1676925 RepID=UPI003B976994